MEIDETPPTPPPSGPKEVSNEKNEPK